MFLLVSCSLFYYIVFYLILFYSIPCGGTTRTMAQAAGTTPLSIATEPAFQSALQAATGNETDIATLHTKHISDFGGYYLADVSFQIHTHIHEYTQTYTQCRFGTHAVNSEFNGVSRFGESLGKDGSHYILIRLFNFSYLFQVSAYSPDKL